MEYTSEISFSKQRNKILKIFYKCAFNFLKKVEYFFLNLF